MTSKNNKAATQNSYPRQPCNETEWWCFARALARDTYEKAPTQHVEVARLQWSGFIAVMVSSESDERSLREHEIVALLQREDVILVGSAFHPPPGHLHAGRTTALIFSCAPGTDMFVPQVVAAILNEAHRAPRTYAA